MYGQKLIKTRQYILYAPSYALDGGNVDEPAVGVRRLGLVRGGRAGSEHVRIRLLSEKCKIRGNIWKFQTAPLRPESQTRGNVKPPTVLPLSTYILWVPLSFAPHN